MTRVARRPSTAAGIAAAALLVALIALAPAQAAHPDGETDRIAGPDRFATAAQLAETAHPDGAATVIIASGVQFPDALAAAALAGDREAPILLTHRDGLPPASRAALDALAPDRVILLGGTGVIGTPVEEALAAEFEVDRLGGVDRFETARRIAEAITSDIGTLPEGGAGGETSPDDRLATAVLTTGGDFPDALAIGPVAYAGIHPILLTSRDSLPEPTREVLADERLGIEQVLVLGGTSAVSEAVEATLRDDLGLAVLRVSGTDRTETAVRIAELAVRAVDGFALTGDANAVAVASGLTFPDALALAPLAGTRSATVLLSQASTTLGPWTGAFIAAHCSSLGSAATPVLVAGGTGVLSAGVEATLTRAAVCEDFVPAGGLTIEPDEATTAVGDDAVFVFRGVNGLGEPAADAPVLVQVFGESTLDEPPEDRPFYRDGGEIFVFDRQQTGFLGEDGSAQVRYANDTPRRERVIVCTPPELDDASCVDEQGAVPDTSHAAVVAHHTWTNGG